MPRGLPGSVMAYFDVDCPARSAELRHADWLVYELLRAFVGQRGRNDAPLELGHLPQDGGHRAEHVHLDGATDEASHGRRCVPCDRGQTRGPPICELLGCSRLLQVRHTNRLA